MVRVGNLVIDAERRHVELDGVPQHLEPQAFDLLAYLLEARDRVVPKSELLDEVWGDQFVSESALTTRIKEIRRAVGDDGVRQEVIKNFRGRGYRFVADVDAGTQVPPVSPASDSSSPEGPRSGDAWVDAVLRSGAATGLVGREREIDAAVAAVMASPVTTLVGPGGVGKTTLAIEVARRVRESFTDGVRVTRLARLRDASEVSHAVRRDLGITDAGSDDETRANVADLDALVVIDNCEHVIDEVARIVADVAALGGRVRMIATSRERLGVAGEQVCPIEPLSIDEAHELLIERVRSLRPDFRWPVDDEPLVHRLLEMIDRLPLAIEMAAARLPTVGVTELVEHLTERLDLLGAGARSRTHDDRQQTLAALVDWSLRLLDDDARETLIGLTVFAASAELGDLAAVLERDPVELALGPLAELVEQSLLVADTSLGPTRYRMLETVRAPLVSRREASIDERHARHITREVERADDAVRRAGDPAASQRLDALVPEVRRAHRWARDHDLALAEQLTAALLHDIAERLWREPAAWCSDLDARSAEQPVFAAVVAIDAANRGDDDRALHLARIALESDDPRVVGSGLDTTSNVGLNIADFELTRSCGERLLALGTERGDSSLWALGAVGPVLADIYEQHPDAARARFDALEPPPRMGPTGRAWLAYTEGELLLVAERRAGDAVECFDRAIELGSSVGSSFVVSVSEVSRLSALARADDLDDAIATMQRVLDRHRRRPRTIHAVTLLRNVVGLLARAERDRAAMEVLGALEVDDVKPLAYGAEYDLLAHARDVAESRHGVQAVERWVAAGGTHDLAWAIDRAVGALSIDPGR